MTKNLLFSSTRNQHFLFLNRVLDIDNRCIIYSWLSGRCCAFSVIPRLLDLLHNYIYFRALENDHFTLSFQVLGLEILPPYIEQKDLIHFFLLTRTKLCLFLFRCRVTYKDDNSGAKKLDASRFMVSRDFKE